MMIRRTTILSLALFAAGCNQSIPDANGNRAAYVGMVDQAAHSAGVPARIARAVVRHESGFNPNLRGRAGEWGLGQIFCSTARGEGFTGPCAALRDPQTNLTFSMKYLRRALDKGGAGCAGVSLYQTGVGARPRCTAYGRAVQQRME